MEIKLVMYLITMLFSIFYLFTHTMGWFIMMFVMIVLITITDYFEKK